MKAPSIKVLPWGMVLFFLSGWVGSTAPAAAQPVDSLILKTHRAVARGLAYFSSPRRVLDTDAVLLHAYLKDRFNLPVLVKAEAVLAQVRADSTGQFHMFLRLAEPAVCRMDFLDAGGGNELALAGVWYDELPEPELLMQRIGEAELNEPYQATHALWAMAMAHRAWVAWYGSFNSASPIRCISNSGSGSSSYHTPASASSFPPPASRKSIRQTAGSAKRRNMWNCPVESARTWANTASAFTNTGRLNRSFR